MTTRTTTSTCTPLQGTARLSSRYVPRAARRNAQELTRTQYGGDLRPELVYGGGEGAAGTVSAADAMAASAAASRRRERVSRRTLDAVAPETVLGPVRRRRRAVAKQTEATGECAICLEDMEKGNRTRTMPRCAHAFHSDCILQWLANSPLCPGTFAPFLILQTYADTHTVCMQSVVNTDEPMSV